jgi:hypothetical protein
MEVRAAPGLFFCEVPKPQLLVQRCQENNEPGSAFRGSVVLPADVFDVCLRGGEFHVK